MFGDSCNSSKIKNCPYIKGGIAMIKSLVKNGNDMILIKAAFFYNRRKKNPHFPYLYMETGIRSM
jgi:hypothetical protein